MEQPPLRLGVTKTARIGSTLGHECVVRQSPAESDHAAHHGSERGPVPLAWGIDAGTNAYACTPDCFINSHACAMHRLCSENSLSENCVNHLRHRHGFFPASRSPRPSVILGWKQVSFDDARADTIHLRGGIRARPALS